MSPRTTSLSRPRRSARPSTSTRERSTITSRRTLGKSRRDALVALVAGLLTATGAALAVPVPVLSISDGAAEYVAPLEPGEPLLYSYRQSIYQVTVYEDLSRVGDGIGIERARSSDIRSIEYFGWRGEPVRQADGLWAENAPASVAVDPELVIRITPAGEQRLATARWDLVLKPRFGETVVHVRAQDRPWLLAVLEGRR